MYGVFVQMFWGVYECWTHIISVECMPNFIKLLFDTTHSIKLIFRFSLCCSMAATSHHSFNRFASLARKQDFADFNLAGPPRGHYASLMLKRAHNLIYSENEHFFRRMGNADKWRYNHHSYCDQLTTLSLSAKQISALHLLDLAVKIGFTHAFFCSISRLSWQMFDGIIKRVHVFLHFTLSFSFIF